MTNSKTFRINQTVLGQVLTDARRVQERSRSLSARHRDFLKQITDLENALDPRLVAYGGEPGTGYGNSVNSHPRRPMDDREESALRAELAGLRLQLISLQSERELLEDESEHTGSLASAARSFAALHGQLPEEFA